MPAPSSAAGSLLPAASGRLHHSAAGSLHPAASGRRGARPCAPTNPLFLASHLTAGCGEPAAGMTLFDPSSAAGSLHPAASGRLHHSAAGSLHPAASGRRGARPCAPTDPLFLASHFTAGCGEPAAGMTQPPVRQRTRHRLTLIKTGFHPHKTTKPPATAPAVSVRKSSEKRYLTSAIF